MAFRLIAGEHRSRLLTVQQMIASLFAVRNTKCVFQDLGFPHRILRHCTSDVTDWEHRRIVKRLPVSPVISNHFIGVREQNLASLLSECGFGAEISVRGNDIYVSATDAEVLKDTMEKVSQEVELLSVQFESSLRVYEIRTDNDRFIHDRIVWYAIGKYKDHLLKLLPELEESDRFVRCECCWKTGILKVYDQPDNVNKAIEKSVERFKVLIRRALFYTELSTDDNPGRHNLICSLICGKEEDEVRRWTQKVNLYMKKTGVIIVNGLHPETVKSEVEITTQEITRIKEEISNFYTQKVSMGNETDIYPMFYSKFCGREGERIERFQSEFGDFLDIYRDDDEGMHVSGVDAEDVKTAAEMITEEFKEFKTMLDSSFTGTVLTDEDRYFHDMLAAQIFGKTQKVDYILKETEVDLFFKKHIPGSIQVYGCDAEVVENITEEMARIVHEFRTGMGLCFTEKVITSDNVVVHGKICGKILESERENINRLISETVNCVRLLTQEVGVIHVYGDDAQVVKDTVERLTQEVEKVRLLIKTE